MKYDLEKRTLNFTKSIIQFINQIRKNLTNVEIASQVIRSSGSIGANYIEANEAFSKKILFIESKSVARRLKK